MKTLGSARLGLVLFLLSPAAGARGKAPPRIEGELIVWSGSASRDEAQAQLDAFQLYADALSELVRIEPRVLESAKVEGLKPGFFVVALGACGGAASKDALSLAQALFPGAYAKHVSYAPSEELPALGCPEFRQAASDDDGQPVPWRLTKSKRVPAGSRTLIGLGFEYSWAQRGDFASEFTGAKAVFLLADAGRRLKASKQLAPGQDTARLTSFESKAAAIAVEVQYADPRCSYDHDAYVGWSVASKASASGDQLEVKSQAPIKGDAGSCGFKEEGEAISGRSGGD